MTDNALSVTELIKAELRYLEVPRECGTCVYYHIEGGNRHCNRNPDFWFETKKNHSCDSWGDRHYG